MCRIGFAACSPDESLGQDARRSLRELMPEALLSRIGWENICYLPALDSTALRNIVRLAAQDFARAEGIQVRLHDDVAARIVEDADTGKHGARAALDLYRDRVETKLDKALEKHRPGQIIAVLLDPKSGEIVTCPVSENPVEEGGKDGSIDE
jgi:ATP-dependent Clp protease ATP-binding subunit ClpA